MNLLIITVCILIEVAMIIAQSIKRLPTTRTPENINDLKLVPTPPHRTSTPVHIDFSTDIVTPTTDIVIVPPTTPKSTLIPYYSGSKKLLYNYNYNTTDTGIQVQEVGYLFNEGTHQETLEARGSYNYIDNDGNTFKVSYIANEDGFQPEGAHLPIVPPLIKKALQYIAEHSKGNGKE